MTRAERLFPELNLLRDEHITFEPECVPDALVLVTLQTCCKCGSNHAAPNSRLMLRYKRQIHRIDRWKTYYNDLPREHFVHVENVAACTECFERSNWSFEDFE